MKFYKIDDTPYTVTLTANAIGYWGSGEYRLELIKIKNGVLIVNGALGTFYGKDEEDALRELEASLTKTI